MGERLLNPIASLGKLIEVRLYVKFLKGGSVVSKKIIDGDWVEARRLKDQKRLGWISEERIYQRGRIVRECE